MVVGLLADQPQYFLVDLKIKPTNNIKLFLDGDQGITIEKCIFQDYLQMCSCYRFWTVKNKF